MITLTNPKQVNSVLGGTDTVNYDKFVLQSITYEVVTGRINGQIRITSTGVPGMTPIIGTLVIAPNGLLTVEVQQLDFYRQMTLTGPQNAAVQAMIRDAQSALESGLITVGVVAGVQSAGV